MTCPYARFVEPEDETTSPPTTATSKLTINGSVNNDALAEILSLTGYGTSSSAKPELKRLPSSDELVTYGNYLQLNLLLNSQVLLSAQNDQNKNPVHDEHLFMIIHQTFELWFKQIIWEIDSLRDIFGDDSIDESYMFVSINRLQRCVQIWRLLCDQIIILETMTPLDFMEFRSYLSPASGFQSLQFRLIENKLGLTEKSRVLYNQSSYKNAFPSAHEQKELTNSLEEATLLMVIERWLERTPGLEDTSFNFWERVSVRKRVVKIFRDVCLSQPDFVRIPDICSRLLRRINDEESIRKLVLETFQQLWFTPTRNHYEIRQRVQTIIDVLIDAQKQNNTWLENLVKEFLQTNDKQSNDDKARIREQRKDVLKAIHDIINELVESILKIESANDQVSSNKMVAKFVALNALGKANPEHVLSHVSTIVEYLNIKCTSYNDNVIVQYVAKILEFTVPLMKSASSSIIYSLEGSLTKLLLVSGQLVIHSSIACLAAAVRLSKNVALVKEVFLRYHSFIIQCQLKIIENPNDEFKGSAQLARSIYILGVLCKYFDIERSEYDDLQFSVEDIFQLFMFFIERPDSVVKLKSLVGLGYFLQRYGQYLIEDTIRQLYHTYLLDRRPLAAQLRCQVLINLEEYFRDCIRRMAEQDIDYLHLPSTTNTNEDENSNDAHQITGANLKDTTDIHSEMASSIAQCYLRIVLDTYLSEDEIIRQCVRKVVSCILEQGLVHPVQFIPFLIAMTTDRDINIQQSAEQNLQDLDKTNPGIIQTKVMQGFKMSYQLQKLLLIQYNNNQQVDPQSDIIRGMTKVAVTSMTNQQLPYCSVNHFLYSLIRSSRVYRRGLITQLLKMFDNDSSNISSSLTLEEQLFVADNLAYFPYQVQDEPLFIVEQIDLSISVIGSTQLQQFRDLLKQHLDYVDDDEGIDMNKLENKLNDVSETIINELNQCLRLTKPTMLLLLLKSYLKDVYYLNDTKIIEYDHTESSKITDRPILTRKINVKFEPKIILDTIKPINTYDTIQKRKQLIKEFADFKRYLLAFDTDIEDTIQSISELLPASFSTSKGKKKGSGSSRRRKVMIDSDDDSVNGDF
ncbi:unnamed protein product [Rotaria sp. Silwood2]|nr:unnamed protein product [Rotaria sp. Silwood2]